MALVKGRYYLQSVRIGRRVTSVYCGSGPAALANAALAAERRAGREQAGREAEAAEAEQRRIADAEEGRSEGARRLVEANLIAVGCHRGHRDIWRRRRMPPPPAPAAASPP